jgi:prepilin-type N-terminal cleavage/methylation domain-containing protein
MKKTQAGFTIVELLLVIVVIAILAAITIVAYRGISERAAKVALENDLVNLSKKLNLYKAETDSYPAGGYPSINAAKLEYKANASLYATNSTSPAVTRNLIYCPSTNLDTFGILAKLKSGEAYILRQGASVQPYTGSWGTTTAAGTLCSNAGYTSESTAGYYVSGSYTGWQSWTGITDS